MTGLLAAEGGGAFNPLDPAAWGNTFWTWVIFLAALPFMIRFVFGPIARALAARDEAARAAGEAAARDREAAKAGKAEVEARLEAVREEEARLLAEARARADLLGRELLEKARVEGERELARAREAIALEKARALDEIRGQVVDLALMAARRVVGRELVEADHRAYVAELVQGTARDGEA